MEYCNFALYQREKAVEHLTVIPDEEVLLTKRSLCEMDEVDDWIIKDNFRIIEVDVSQVIRKAAGIQDEPKAVWFNRQLTVDQFVLLCG